MAGCLFQEMWEPRGTRKALSRGEASALPADGVEVPFRRCFSVIFLYSRSYASYTCWEVDSEGGILNVEIMLRQDRLCAFFCYMSDMYDMDGMLLGPPR